MQDHGGNLHVCVVRFSLITLFEKPFNYRFNWVLSINDLISISISILIVFLGFEFSECCESRHKPKEREMALGDN
jgi:hypothetical protein